MPTNIKPHLSELHAFEQMTFGTNMSIQSSGGVKKTAEAIAGDAVPANTAPVLSGATSTGDLSTFTQLTNIGLTIADDNLALVTWTLSYTKLGGVDTGTFSQTTGTGNTLSGITFDAVIGGSNGRTIEATVIDSGSGSSEIITIYSD